MKRAYILFLLIILLANSCKKDPNDKLVIPVIIPPVEKCFYLESESGLLKTTFLLNQDQSIKEIRKTNSRGDEIITFTKIKNFTEVKSNKNGYLYQYFLNKKGYADSIWITYIGLVDLKEYHTFNKDGYLIKSNLLGTIVNVPFEEISTFTYLDGNLIKKSVENDGEMSEETYEYYTDSTNYFIANQDAETFVPASKNLIKKINFPDDKFVVFTYEKDTIGIVTQYSINESEETKLTTYKFSCK
jgi:hypothetical protein